MSDAFEQALSALYAMHAKFPDWQLGQMVVNLATMARGPAVESV